MLNLIQNSFYIETYGCTSNKADSYLISTVLAKSNYKPASLDDAHFVIINTCGVKQQTENKIKTRLSLLYENFKQDSNKKFIITGCLPFIDNNYIDIIKDIIPNFSAIVDLDNTQEFPAIFNKIKEGNANLVIKSQKLIDKADFLIDHSPGKITGIIPISEGCLGACTYCCVKNARGRLNCYNPDKIIQNTKHQLEQKIKQIYLTSQDCSTYQYDGIGLVDLIENIVNLEYKFYLRIGMLNPKYLVKNLKDLQVILKLNKVYRFLHIPIQSGSDKVLKMMNRPYKIKDIKKALKILRENFPNLTISTDVICGFPQESENDFEKTIDLIKWLKPEILNISKFTPRPGTKAKNMEQLDSKLIKERSIQLSAIFRNSLVDMNKNWEGWKGEVLILHQTAKENQVFGRNLAYKNIFIDDFKGQFGSFVIVRINKVDGFNLFGQILD